MKLEAGESRSSEADNVSTITSNAAAGYIGSLAITGAGLATKLLLIRNLTPADYGLVATAQNAVVVLLMASGLGIQEAVVRYVGVHAGAPKQVKGVVIRSAMFTLTTSAIVAVSVLGLAGSIGRSFDLGDSQTYALLLVALAVPPMLLADVFGAAYRGLNQTLKKILRQDLPRVMVTFVGCSILVLMGAASFLNVLAVQLLAALLSLLIAAASFMRSESWQVQANHARLDNLLLFALPLFVSGLVGGTLVGSGIPLALATQQSAEAVALYSVALALQPLIQMPANAIENAAIPVWASSELPVLRQTFSYLSKWSLLFGMLGAIPVMLAPHETLTAVFGSQYADAVVPLRFSIGTALFTIALGPTEGVLRALGLTRTILTSRLLGGCIGFALAWPLAAQWGVLGALVAWSLGGIISNLGYSGYLLFRLSINPMDKFYLRTLIAGLLAAFGAWALGNFVPPGMRLTAVVGVNTVVLLVISVSLGAWTIEEARHVIRRAIGPVRA